MLRVLQPIRDGGWLTRRRATAYAWILLVCECAGLLLGIAGTHGLVVALPHPLSTDFVSFYAAGRLAAQGTAWLAYDQAAHYVAEQMATEPGIAYNFFYYPPVFLLLCRALARMPYLLAFVAFQGGALMLCLLAVRTILRDTKFVFLLAFPAVFWTLGTGQNAFLTAALFAAATLQIDRRPVLAGMLFGALCYKPHFGLLIPVALLAGGHVRAVITATGSVLALVGLSGGVLGWQTWTAFLHAMAASQAVYTTDAIDLAGLASPFGATLVVGLNPSQAGMVQAVATVGAGVLVGVVWRRKLSLPVRAAVLLAATPVAVPIVMFYDLMLSGIALAWLVRSGEFAPWTRTLMAAAFVLPLVSGNLHGTVHWLVAPMAAWLVLVLAVVAAWRELRRAGQSDGVMTCGNRVAEARSTITPGAAPAGLGVQT